MARRQLGEFALIDQYFRDLGARRPDLLLGIGDDGALIATPDSQQLVVVADTLVAGRHFPIDCPPRSVGHRALAVNLSDLAAMGATPAHALLCLTLPAAEPQWLTEFARGFGDLALTHEVALAGGDTTAGPLTVSVTALGYVPPGAALQRRGAQPGDVLFVSGTPGDAALGLALLQNDATEPLDQACSEYLLDRFCYPTPRLALGIALRGIATACIDISDGLAGDVSKLAAASACLARIDKRLLPLSVEALTAVGEQRAAQAALTGGDDYELCFTVSAAHAAALPQRLAPWARVTAIGVMAAGSGVTLQDGATVTQLTVAGYDHFA